MTKHMPVKMTKPNCCIAMTAFNKNKAKQIALNKSKVSSFGNTEVYYLPPQPGL